MVNLKINSVSNQIKNFVTIYEITIYSIFYILFYYINKCMN